MNNKLTILVMGILILIISCQKDKPNLGKVVSKTCFDIGSSHYTCNKTICYLTKWGGILNVSGEDFELFIVLSDTLSKTFSITDTINGQDSGKARCIFKQNSGYNFSTSGSVVFDLAKKSGSFLIDIGGLNLKNGQLVIDTLINGAIIDFSSITERDEMGYPLILNDTSDWDIRVNWNIIERLVFNLKAKNTNSSDIKLIEYPNPFNEIMLLNLEIPKEFMVEAFIVNSNFEIEKKYKRLQPGRVALLFDNPSYKGNNYRLYYKIYSDLDAFYGSGDLKVK